MLCPPRGGRMITTDPQQRARRLAEVQDLLGREASAEDRDLIQAFAPVVFAEMPDWMVAGLSARALAARLKEYFTFFVREFPPSTQLYRGLPGIHVVVKNPTEPAEQRTLGGRLLPFEC